MAGTGSNALKLSCRTAEGNCVHAIPLFWLAIAALQRAAAGGGDSLPAIFVPNSGQARADVQFLDRLQRDFPATQVLSLDQNFRSTGQIIELANSLARPLGSPPLALLKRRFQGIAESLLRRLAGRKAIDDHEQIAF